MHCKVECRHLEGSRIDDVLGHEQVWGRKRFVNGGMIRSDLEILLKHVMIVVTEWQDAPTMRWHDSHQIAKA